MGSRQRKFKNIEMFLKKFINLDEIRNRISFSKINNRPDLVVEREALWLLTLEGPTRRVLDFFNELIQEPEPNVFQSKSSKINENDQNLTGFIQLLYLDRKGTLEKYSLENMHVIISHDTFRAINYRKLTSLEDVSEADLGYYRHDMVVRRVYKILKTISLYYNEWFIRESPAIKAYTQKLFCYWFINLEKVKNKRYLVSQLKRAHLTKLQAKEIYLNLYGVENFSLIHGKVISCLDDAQRRDYFTNFEVCRFSSSYDNFISVSGSYKSLHNFVCIYMENFFYSTTTNCILEFCNIREKRFARKKKNRLEYLISSFHNHFGLEIPNLFTDSYS